MELWAWKKYILKLKKKKRYKAKILNFNQILNELDFFFLISSCLDRTLNKYHMGKRNEIKMSF